MILQRLKILWGCMTSKLSLKTTTGCTISEICWPSIQLSKVLSRFRTGYLWQFTIKRRNRMMSGIRTYSPGTKVTTTAVSNLILSLLKQKLNIGTGSKIGYFHMQETTKIHLVCLRTKILKIHFAMIWSQILNQTMKCLWFLSVTLACSRSIVLGIFQLKNIQLKILLLATNMTSKKMIWKSGSLLRTYSARSQ